MHDIQTEEDIHLLVDEFYSRVRKDARIGPIFNEVIGDHWDRHLPIMYSFWSTILLAKNSYHGNPVAVHFKLTLEKEDFNHWLQHFEATVYDLFAGEKADEAVKRSRSIAAIMHAKLNMLKNNN